MIEKIVSGGQTGVDRAALDIAIKYDIPWGGWCPKGRIDENGLIPSKYFNLCEISGEFNNEKENYKARTKFNIKDSDGTLIIVKQLPLLPNINEGTILTIQEVQNQNKPYLITELNQSIDQNVFYIYHWLEKENIKILNVAGPRESSAPGVYALTVTLLENVFSK